MCLAICLECQLTSWLDELLNSKEAALRCCYERHICPTIQHHMNWNDSSNVVDTLELRALEIQVEGNYGAWVVINPIA